MKTRAIVLGASLVIFVGCASSSQQAPPPAAGVASSEEHATTTNEPVAKNDPTGWWCNGFVQGKRSATSCSRTSDECEVERTAMLQRGAPMSECVRTERAVCIVFVNEAWSCMATMDECHKVESMVEAKNVRLACAETG